MVAASLWNKGYVYDILLEAAHKGRLIADELLQKIQAIHNQGFLPSITDVYKRQESCLFSTMSIYFRTFFSAEISGCKVSSWLRSSAPVSYTHLRALSHFPFNFSLNRHFLNLAGRLATVGVS